MIDNFTYIRAAHSYKFGIDYQRIHDERMAAPQFLYTFPSIAAYQAAKAGASPFGYSSMTQITGDLSFAMDTSIYSTFVQDDWQIAPTVKVLYGVRYDLYQYPEGLADAPLAQTREFNIDKNNWGPRAGVAWAVTPTTAVRGSVGIMYDQPILGGYEQALQLSGSPKAPAYTFNGSAGRRARVSRPGGHRHAGDPVALGRVVRISRSRAPCRPTCSSSRRSAATSRPRSASSTRTATTCRSSPTSTSVNADSARWPTAGRSIHGERSTRRIRGSTASSRCSRSAIRRSRALTLQASKRLSQGLTFNIQYVTGKGIDNTPLLTQLTVQAEQGRSDPSNLDRDKGPNPLDMRHNLSGNIVYTSSSSASNAVVRALLDGNQIGVLLQLNSSLPVNIRSNADLNGDGVASDRPLFVGRNSMYLPNRYNVDLRYTRFIPLRGSVRAEVIAEMKNVFNTEQMSRLQLGRDDRRGRQSDRRRFPATRTGSRAPPATSSGNSSWVSRSASERSR